MHLLIKEHGRKSSENLWIYSLLIELIWNVPTLSQRLCWVKCIFTSMLQCKLFTTLMSLNLGCLVKFTSPAFPFIETIFFLNNDKNQIPTKNLFFHLESHLEVEHYFFTNCSQQILILCYFVYLYNKPLWFLFGMCLCKVIN